MGKDRLIDRSIDPVRALAAGDITTVQAQQLYNGVIPIGDYKGAAAILDVDKLVNQPLVSAEQQYIAGILSGREEDYDLQTITVPITAVATTLMSASLTVPAGELWFVNAVRMYCPGDPTAGFTMNWHSDLWTDRAAVPSTFGQSFHSAVAALANADGITTHVAPAGVAITNLDEFGPMSAAWLISNKIPLLRLPADTIITFTVLTDTALPTAATACTLGLYGAIGKALVV